MILRGSKQDDVKGRTFHQTAVSSHDRDTCVHVCARLLPPQDLQQFSNAVVMFCLINEPETVTHTHTGFEPEFCWFWESCSVLLRPVEDVVDLAADVSTKTQKLAVDAVEDGFQEVPFPWILAIEQLQQLHTDSG